MARPVVQIYAQFSRRRRVSHTIGRVYPAIGRVYSVAYRVYSVTFPVLHSMHRVSRAIGRVYIKDAENTKNDDENKK